MTTCDVRRVTEPACLHCDEPVRDPWPEWRICLGGDGTTRRALHRECAMRLAIGGLNHLLGTCTCCGGTQPPDPPTLTRRAAAVAAVVLWQLQLREERERADP